MLKNKIIMSSKLTFSKYKQIRWYSTKQKMTVINSVGNLLSTGELKYKRHPGVTTSKHIEQPAWLLNTIKLILRDNTISLKMIYENGQKLARHLNARRLPPEKEDIHRKLKIVKSKTQADKTEDLNNDDILKNPKAKQIFKSIVYNWAPIEYNKYKSLTYLVNRSMPEYSVLHRIFQEIANNDKNFIPRTLFDYGSGIGTVIWAASQFWINSIKEYYCVDISRDMNELSEYFIKKATPQIKPNYIFYRQFFPASPIPTYDIVVSAYSLLELPNQKSRLEVISKLWRKTEQYLIIIEQGTNVGFSIVNEARDFVLSCKTDAHDAHVFSPCPHDVQCPRYMEDDTPCNFEISYQTLPIGEKSIHKFELYSYIVLKKGKRSDDNNWPRIVRPVLKRSKHVICRMCLDSGKLEEQIFTKWKNGKTTYRCARRSSWGDCLPFKFEEANETEESE